MTASFSITTETPQPTHKGCIFWEFMVMVYFGQATNHSLNPCSPSYMMLFVIVSFNQITAWISMLSMAVHHLVPLDIGWLVPKGVNMACLFQRVYPRTQQLISDAIWVFYDYFNLWPICGIGHFSINVISCYIAWCYIKKLKQKPTLDESLTCYTLLIHPLDSRIGSHDSASKKWW